MRVLSKNALKTKAENVKANRQFDNITQIFVGFNALRED